MVLFWPKGPMRHGTRQLSGKRARHGAGHRRVAGFYSAAWPDIAPPLTEHLSRRRGDEIEHVGAMVADSPKCIAHRCRCYGFPNVVDIFHHSVLSNYAQSPHAMALEPKPAISAANTPTMTTYASNACQAAPGNPVSNRVSLPPGMSTAPRPMRIPPVR